MHFRPHVSANERKTCARIWDYKTENFVKIGSQKKVDKVKFLGVIIDDKLNWEPHIEHLTEKLTSSIVMIKRVIKFIPKAEYNKIYDALFKSHMT